MAAVKNISPKSESAVDVIAPTTPKVPTPKSDTPVRTLQTPADTTAKKSPEASADVQTEMLPATPSQEYSGDDLFGASPNADMAPPVAMAKIAANTVRFEYQ